jgi:ATP-dependent DNA helicase RecG
MDALELKRRIDRGEDLHTEFKVALPDPGALAKSITCFANTDGGQLIVGVSDRGAIAGIEDLDRAMRTVDDVALHRVEPPAVVLQETVELEGSKVLVVNVAKGSQRPYRTDGGLFYIRSSNRCRQATREELLRLFQATESLYFDETIVHRATLKDLSLDAFDDFLKERFGIAASPDEHEAYLRNLHLAAGDKPTLAGLLFFGKKPQAFLPSARIVAAFIRGTDIAVAPSDKKDIGGRVPEILDDAARFLKLYLTEKHEINGLESEVRPEIPDAAWREALVNAVAHRDYAASAPIRLLVFADRVEFRTPGTLPNTVTIERVRLGGAHVLRNPTVYNLLARMGLVTDLGSGVRRIIRAVKEASGGDVGLEETETEFVVTLPRQVR